MEFAAQAGDQVTCQFFGAGAAQDGDEPGALDLDLVAEIGSGRQGGVTRGPAVFLLHPAQSRPKFPWPGNGWSRGCGS